MYVLKHKSSFCVPPAIETQHTCCTTLRSHDAAILLYMLGYFEYVQVSQRSQGGQFNANTAVEAEALIDKYGRIRAGEGNVW